MRPDPKHLFNSHFGIELLNIGRIYFVLIIIVMSLWSSFHTILRLKGDIIECIRFFDSGRQWPNFMG